MSIYDLIFIAVFFLSTFGVWALHWVAYEYVGWIGIAVVLATALYGKNLYWTWEMQQLEYSDFSGNRYMAMEFGITLMNGIMTGTIWISSMGAFLFHLLRRIDP